MDEEGRQEREGYDGRQAGDSPHFGELLFVARLFMLAGLNHPGTRNQSLNSSLTVTYSMQRETT